MSAIPMLRGFFMEVLSRAWSGVVWFWTALLSYYSLPGWVFLIIGLFAFVGLAIGIAFLYNFLKPQKELEYRNYTEDMLQGAKWRWSWNGNKISNLWCFCPSCDAQLVYSEGYDDMASKTDFICERCSSSETGNYYGPHNRVVTTVRGGDKDYALAATKREILRRIRTGEYSSIKK